MLKTYSKWNQITTDVISRLENDMKKIYNEPRVAESRSYTCLQLSEVLQESTIRSLLGQIGSQTDGILVNRRDAPKKFQPASETKHVRLVMPGKKVGQLLKRAEGPFDFGWNQRKIVLDGNTLLFYDNPSDTVPKKVIKINKAIVSELKEIDGHQNAFTVEVAATGKVFYFAGETKEVADSWRDAFTALAHQGGTSTPMSITQNGRKGSSELPRTPFGKSQKHDQSKEIEISYKKEEMKGEEEEEQREEFQDLRDQIENDGFRNKFRGRSKSLIEKNLALQRSNMAEQYHLSEIPPELSYLKDEIAQVNEVDEDTEWWRFLAFKNGIRLFETTREKRSHKKVTLGSFKMIFLAIAVSVMLNFFIWNKSILVLVGGMIAVGVVLSVVLKLFSRKQHRFTFLAKMTLDDGAPETFARLKKFKFRQNWDISIQSISKAGKISKAEKEYQIQFNIPKINKKFSKNQNQVVCSTKRFNFLLDDDIFYIVERSTLPVEADSKHDRRLIITDVISIRKHGESSHKCSLSLFSVVDTNLLASKDFREFKRNKIKSLALAKRFLAEQRFQEENQSEESDSESEMQEEPQLLSAKGKQRYENNTIKSHIKGYSVAEPDGNDAPQYTKQVSSIKGTRYSERGLNPELKSNFEEQIKLVDALIEGKVTDVPVKKFEERKPGYRLVKTGGIECCNPEEIKSQEGIILDLMKRAGKLLAEGKNVVGVSLPVKIFEPRSLIERISDWWAFGPIYLRRAVRIKDPVERMKNVMAFAISGLYMGCKQMKPFNPILGETYQGFWPDGTELYCEHTSHHPPITNFIVTDPNKAFTFSGYYEYRGKVLKLGNAVAVHGYGPNRIKFADGCEIEFNLPPVRLSGFLWGARLIEWVDNLNFVDKTNGISGVIKFYKNESMFGKDEHPSDYLEGTIHDTADPKKVHSKIKGYWTSYLEFDGRRYWDLEKIDPVTVIHTADPMPSDCRFREDLIWLAKKDQSKSQEHKIRLEEIQRRDRRLRNEHNPKKH